jgi:hypothetical protein
MKVLGIITCQILELEFAYLLARDPDLGCISIIEDDFSSGFIKAMEANGCNHFHKIARLGDSSPRGCSGRLESVVRVMELGLHNRKHLLQQGLVQATQEMGKHVDAIMLGYGLCGNALEKPEEMLKSAGVPLFRPMDTDHPVDDCVGLILGGREPYYAEQCRTAGTFYMIPGFARHWKQMLEKEFGRYGLDLVKRMFVAYQRTLIIPTPVLSEAQMKPDVEAFNQLFGLRSEVKEGTLEILLKTLHEAKDFLLSKATKEDGRSNI